MIAITGMCVKDFTVIRMLKGLDAEDHEAANGEMVIKLSGRMDAENLGELEKRISAYIRKWIMGERR